MPTRIKDLTRLISTSNNEEVYGVNDDTSYKLPITLFKFKNMGIQPIAINGPTIIPKLKKAIYKISNYDSSVSYTVTTLSGTAIINGKNIEYTPGPEVGIYGFIVNNITYNIEIRDVTITKPIITSPINNSTGLSTTLYVSSSIFNISNNEVYQSSSEWQIATDNTFTTIVNSSSNYIDFPNFYLVENLQLNTTYYIRMRYNTDLYGSSEWSDTVTFTTAISHIPSATNLLMPHFINGGNLANISYRFGESVKVNNTGTRMFVSCPGDRGNRGSVYIYERLSNEQIWIFKTRIFIDDIAYNENNPDTVSDDYFFGCSIDIDTSGTTLIVGEEGYNNHRGRVHIYRLINDTTWESKQIINNTNTIGEIFTATNGIFRFGSSVSFRGITDGCTSNILLISAIGANSDNILNGNCYIYEDTNDCSNFNLTKTFTVNNTLMDYVPSLIYGISHYDLTYIVSLIPEIKFYSNITNKQEYIHLFTVNVTYHSQYFTAYNPVNYFSLLFYTYWLDINNENNYINYDGYLILDIGQSTNPSEYYTAIFKSNNIVNNTKDRYIVSYNRDAYIYKITFLYDDNIFDGYLPNLNIVFYKTLVQTIERSAGFFTGAAQLAVTTDNKLQLLIGSLGAASSTVNNLTTNNTGVVYLYESDFTNYNFSTLELKHTFEPIISREIANSCFSDIVYNQSGSDYIKYYYSDLRLGISVAMSSNSSLDYNVYLGSSTTLVDELSISKGGVYVFS